MPWLYILEGYNKGFMGSEMRESFWKTVAKEAKQKKIFRLVEFCGNPIILLCHQITNLDISLTLYGITFLQMSDIFVEVIPRNITTMVIFNIVSGTIWELRF